MRDEHGQIIEAALPQTGDITGIAFKAIGKWMGKAPQD